MIKFANILEKENKIHEEGNKTLESFASVMNEVAKAGTGQVDALMAIDKSINRLIQLQADRPVKKLSATARYVIWWLTQIETDVYDTQYVSWESYKDKILKRREKQEPTDNCQCILKNYPDLHSDFNDLLPDEKSLSNLIKEIKEGTELRNYLDKVGQQILILKQNVAIQVKDNDETEKCIASQKSQVMTSTKRS